jgi:hypothetical protein
MQPAVLDNPQPSPLLPVRRQVQMEVGVGDPAQRGYYQGVDNHMDSAIAYFQSIGFREVRRECNGASDWSICEEANLVFCRAGRECDATTS